LLNATPVKNVAYTLHYLTKSCK